MKYNLVYYYYLLKKYIYIYNNNSIYFNCSNVLEMYIGKKNVYFFFTF